LEHSPLDKLTDRSRPAEFVPSLAALTFRREREPAGQQSLERLPRVRRFLVKHSLPVGQMLAEIAEHAVCVKVGRPAAHAIKRRKLGTGLLTSLLALL